MALLTIQPAGLASFGWLCSSGPWRAAQETSRGRLSSSVHCLAPSFKFLPIKSCAPRELKRASVLSMLLPRGGESSRAYGVFSGMVGHGASALRRQQQAWKDVTITEKRGRTGSIVTMALPSDAYWITAFQAIGVAVLMFASALVGGVLMNIKVEKDALREFNELVAKGIDPESLIKEDADFDREDSLYVFNSKDIESLTRPARNRPVREESEPEPEPEPELELEAAAQQVQSRDGIPN